MNYYNENDVYAAQWLRNLIDAGHIAAGEVDERDIRDVQPGDLTGYRQCHFFAGIGGWSYALRLAGWPDDRPCWTCSCPCQPFSVAGKRKGASDERHLWPQFARLITECKPAIIFGEQVAGADGRAWLNAVRTDLEGNGYAVGAADLCAAGVGAPHIRQRLYWVADARCECDEFGRGTGDMARPGIEVAAATPERQRRGNAAGDRGAAIRLDNTDSQRCAEHSLLRGESHGNTQAAGSGEAGFWDGCDWLYCTDGAYRPVESGTQPLAFRVPKRMGKLRAYGNAIVPQIAAEFIVAFDES